MKRNTIKWRIFKYNIIVIIMLIALVAIIFNVAVRLYIEKDILGQLSKIESRTEDIALRKGPDFFPKQANKIEPPPPRNVEKDIKELPKFDLMLDRSLRDSLSVLNANYILLDKDKKRINTRQEESSDDIADKITVEAVKSADSKSKKYLNPHISGTEYIALVSPVISKNSFGLGYIVIYSSLEKINQLQIAINIILFAILILSALVIVIFSSLAAKKVSEPFSSLNEHIGAIAERNFGTKIDMPVYDELKEFVDNINIMSEKLETYDKAQKTFLQNASHEFRTPLMSIQSYAEGIKYDVVDSKEASDIIIDETKRMTHLVEDLLYLSRLETIEENYHFSKVNLNDIVNSCIERMRRITIKNNIEIKSNLLNENIIVYGDEEKLYRAVSNIIGNCIRYAESAVTVTSKVIEDKVLLTISDDGPGFDKNELANIFERFYKGKKGNFGLGLSISKNVIERLNGKISAENLQNGALFKIELNMIKKI